LLGRFQRSVDTEIRLVRQQAAHTLWQSLVFADHKETARYDVLHDPLNDLALQLLGKIRQHEIAAEDEGERFGRHLGADVLLAKLDLALELGAEDVERAGLGKGSLPPGHAGLSRTTPA